MYLLDTNVISEFRRRKPHGGVTAWLAGVAEADIFFSAVSFAELQTGIEVTRERDPARAQEIEAWVDRIKGSYSIIAMDDRIFRQWARLMHRRSSDLGQDAMIAATAMVHKLTVVTRNVRDFEALGVPYFNPFSATL